MLFSAEVNWAIFATWNGMHFRSTRQLHKKQQLPPAVFALSQQNSTHVMFVATIDKHNIEQYRHISGFVESMFFLLYSPTRIWLFFDSFRTITVTFVIH